MYTVFAIDDCQGTVVLYSGGSLDAAHQAFNDANSAYENVCIQIQYKRPFSTVPFIQVIKGKRPSTDLTPTPRPTLTLVK